MFIALDANNQRVPINEAITKDAYYCPVCGEKVIARALNSNKVVPHFAHQKGTECRDSWKYDMSEWHLAWQSRFPNSCREVVIEYMGQKHRADVLVDRVVLEFQHSPISYDDFVSRNKFYTSCGYKVVWLFDMMNKIEENWKNPIKNLDKREIKWKRTQNQFANFNDFGGQVEIYLQYNLIFKKEEKNCILKISSLSTQTAKFRWTDELLSKEHFLCEYGVGTGTAVDSISKILNRSDEKEKDRFERIAKKEEKEREEQLQQERKQKELQKRGRLDAIRNKERALLEQYPEIYLKYNYPTPKVGEIIKHKDYQYMRIVQVELGEYIPTITATPHIQQTIATVGRDWQILDWKKSLYDNIIETEQIHPNKEKISQDALEAVRKRERALIGQYPEIYLKNDYPIPKKNEFIKHKDYQGMRIIDIRPFEHVPIIVARIDKPRIRKNTGLDELELDWKRELFNGIIECLY